MSANESSDVRRIEGQLKEEYSALERETFEYVPRLLALRREVLRSHVHNASTGDWISSLSNLLQVMNTGNNLAQMYGWSRFCWTFGALDTHHALAKLDRLISATQLAFGASPPPSPLTHDRHLIVGFLTATRIRGRALRELITICGQLVKSDAQWPDRDNWVPEAANETH